MLTVQANFFSKAAFPKKRVSTHPFLKIVWKVCKKVNIHSVKSLLLKKVCLYKTWKIKRIDVTILHEILKSYLSKTRLLWQGQASTRPPRKTRTVRCLNTRHFQETRETTANRKWKLLFFRNNQFLDTIKPLRTCVKIKQFLRLIKIWQWVQGYRE